MNQVLIPSTEMSPASRGSSSLSRDAGSWVEGTAAPRWAMSSVTGSTMSSVTAGRAIFALFGAVVALLGVVVGIIVLDGVLLTPAGQT